jgi:hypothetical protein
MLNRKLNYFFIYLLMVFLYSCHSTNTYTTERVCKVLKAKHSENRSSNYRGDFIVVYYFLYEDGDLKEVSLKDFMSFNVSDTLCWKEMVR